VEKALTTADLQQVLFGADREGWAYCRSQDLVREKAGKAASHMAFKRPGPPGSPAAPAAAAELADREAVYTRCVAAAQQELVARDDKGAADKVVAQERDRVWAAEAQAAADKVLAERAVRGALDKDARLREPEGVKADCEALIRKVRAEAKSKAAPPAGKPETQASANDPKKGGEDDRGVGEKGAPTAVRLRHAEAADVARVAEKLLPGSGARVTYDAATNTVIVAGPAGAVADVETVAAAAALDAGPEGGKYG
jgi:hypothetical protein